MPPTFLAGLLIWFWLCERRRHSLPTLPGSARSPVIGAPSFLGVSWAGLSARGIKRKSDDTDAHGVEWGGSAGDWEADAIFFQTLCICASAKQPTHDRVQLFHRSYRRFNSWHPSSSPANVVSIPFVTGTYAGRVRQVREWQFVRSQNIMTHGSIKSGGLESFSALWPPLRSMALNLINWS